MRILLTVLFLGLLLGGCTTRYRQANNLAKEGKFVEAAELFEQLAREDPKDKELPELLQRARWRAIEDVLAHARQARLTEDPVAAQHYFAQGLELRHRWNVRFNGALEQTVDDEREDATMRLRAAVLPHTQKGEALTAESILQKHDFLLHHEELTALRTELGDATLSSGAATCARLTKSVVKGKPYWNSLVAQYCKHFRSAAPDEVPLPDTFSTAQASVNVNGLGDGLKGQLEAALDARLRKGPWYSDRGAQSAVLSTRGEVTVRMRQDPVTLSAEWYESVPYIEHVTKTLTETVPVNECETYEERSSTGQVNQRVREVTKQKTQQRQVVVPETRMRQVPRSFEYQAMRMERSLGFALRTELSVAGQLASAAGQEGSEQQQGYFHDIVFRPAHVAPARPPFHSPEPWMASNIEKLADSFAAEMRQGWRARFCKLSAYEPEEAARCLRAAEGIPAPAVDALTPSMGADAEQAVRLMAAPQS